MKKNVAVIGYGGMGAGFHCKNLLTSDVATLAGIYDIDPKKRELAASRGVKVYETREELLADPTIDIVTIATPNDVHEEIAIAALEAGKNVISEKPVTLSLSLVSSLSSAKRAASTAERRSGESPCISGISGNTFTSFMELRQDIRNLKNPIKSCRNALSEPIIYRPHTLAL